MAPGACSPSRNVVSSTMILSFSADDVIEVMVSSFFVSCIFVKTVSRTAQLAREHFHANLHRLAASALAAPGANCALDRISPQFYFRN